MAAQDATATAEGIDATPTLAAAVIIEPERMPVEEFIALYADPAKRPIIVDVRSSVAYAEGHIAGAVSIPDAETESRLSELPKDRLIVAYCQ
jgi:rhodanese-related sulfurtransferase